MQKYYKPVPVEVWEYRFDENGCCAMPAWVLRQFDCTNWGADYSPLMFKRDEVLCYCGTVVEQGDYLVLDDCEVIYYSADDFKKTFMAYEG